MSEWKVIKTNIELYDHPSADRLQLAKVGTYQVVVQKGLYQGGEEVVFAPEKSVLSGILRDEYDNYLAGPERNRVKAIRLRDELSCGIIIPPHLIESQCGLTIDELPDNENLSKIIGNSLYIPKVPVEMDGIAEPIGYSNLAGTIDVEQFGIYKSNFVDNERVVVTEKVHGSQINVYVAIQDKEIKHRWLSTKNYNKKGLHLLESEGSFYWRAIDDVKLWDIIKDIWGDNEDEIVIQVFGESIPCQKFKYGKETPSVVIFDLRINGRSYPYDQVPEQFKKLWVPVLYDGPYENINEIKKLALGVEQVSGLEFNIKEGIVIRPYIDRRANDGTRLLVKILNPKYKETGEEFN